MKEELILQYGSIPEIMAALTAMIIAFGGGIRWVLNWSDKKVAKIQEELRQQYDARFASLEVQVRAQSEEINRNRDDLARYLRHVGRLEGLLTAHGIEVPVMEKKHG